MSDMFQRQSRQLKRKFGPAPPPAVVRPMSMAERLAEINGIDANIQDFEVDFEDEKQMENENGKGKENARNDEKEQIADSDDAFGQFNGQFEAFELQIDDKGHDSANEDAESPSN